MPEPGEPLSENPIVAMATRLRARRDLDTAIDSAVPHPCENQGDAATLLGAFADQLKVGCKRLNSILGKNGVTFVRLEKPLRVRLRFGDKRIAFDCDAERQLVSVSGLDLDGEYQFDTASDVPALINLSKLSTEAGYGNALTASSVLKAISQDAQLPRPPHLDAPGPMRF